MGHGVGRCDIALSGISADITTLTHVSHRQGKLITCMYNLVPLSQELRLYYIGGPCGGGACGVPSGFRALSTQRRGAYRCTLAAATREAAQGDSDAAAAANSAIMMLGGVAHWQLEHSLFGLAAPDRYSRL